jgi:hypothetical protein
VVYDQSGCVKYHPKNGPQDGQIKKKKKPPPVHSNSPPSPTTPMATSTSATRASTSTRTTPRRLQDYIHGAELDSDSLGLLPVQDYDQSDLSNVLTKSHCCDLRPPEGHGEANDRRRRPLSGSLGWT